MNIGSFAGYAPVNDPRFVILVKIVNPKGVQWAETSAAPAFGKIMKFLLEYYKIKPTEDPKISPTYKTYQGDIKPEEASPVLVLDANSEEDKKTKSDEKKSDKKVIKSED
jgi:hypothetical protein